MSVKFYLEKRGDKQSEQPIKVSVSIRGTRLLSTVGYNISESQWTNGKAKQNAVNAKGITGKMINLRLKRIDTTFDELKQTINHKPSVEELSVILAQIKGKESRIAKAKSRGAHKTSTLYYFDIFIDEESKQSQWRDGTMECWMAFRNHLIAQGGDDIQLSHFDEAGIKAFIDYLRNTKKMGENTVQKHYRNLRWFLNWCIRNNYCKEAEISKYRPKFKVLEKPVIFLTREQLLKLYQYQIPQNGTVLKLHTWEGEEYEKIVHDAAALEKTRDLFCFCAFTSLRFSDMAKLRKSDRSDGYLNVTTQKTNDKLRIELNDYSSAILDKYEQCHFPNNAALPPLSNQKMNDYIKELGELCGFNEPVSRVLFKAGQKLEMTQPKYELLGTHAGRRTFICSALSMGIPPQVVMKWTGHADYKAMKPYIDIAESTRAEEMKKFNKL